jgi:hypothetical protein
VRHLVSASNENAEDGSEYMDQPELRAADDDGKYGYEI